MAEQKLRVHGRCMEPAIRDGDDVLVDPCREWGDHALVAYHREDGMLLKRAHLEEDGLHLRSDDGRVDIFPVDRAAVQGVVVGLVRCL